MKTLSEIHAALEGVAPTARTPLERCLCEVCGRLLEAATGGRRVTRKEAEAWDWTKGNCELSLERGVSKQVAANWRNRLGKSKLWKPCKFSGVDWALPDAEIAARLHYTPQYVRQVRKRLGHPSRNEMKYKRFCAATVGRGSVGPADCRALGLSAETARKYAARAGLAWVRIRGA